VTVYGCRYQYKLSFFYPLLTNQLTPTAYSGGLSLRYKSKGEYYGW